MTAWLLLTIATVGQGSPSSPNSHFNPAPNKTDREIHIIRREVSDLLKKESTAESDSERARLVRRMTEVYREVIGDARFLTHPTLQQQKNKLWTRLTRVRDELKRRRAADRRRPSHEQEDADQLVASQLAVHLQIASQTLGGPAALVNHASGGGAVADDFGDELIDLIQNTIQPDHWNVNGGPGSIVYFRPVHALVVRASSEVHGQVRDTVGALRDAGK